MQSKYSIEKLTKRHDRTLFSCGIDFLDDFIKTKASQQAKQNIIVTYVLLNVNDQIVI